MRNNREAPLTKENLSGAENSKFLIYSPTEIQFILQSIIKEGARAVLYYGGGDDFILTTLLGVDARGAWLDVGTNAADNQSLIQSDNLIFIGSHLQVKVQFEVLYLETMQYENRPAFFLPLPDVMLRLQRREYFRLPIPASRPLKCFIPVTPPTIEQNISIPKREVTIMNISVGGMALVCEEQDTELLPGETYSNCQISLPGTGILTATIRVKNSFEVTLRNGIIRKRAGCEFIHMGREMTLMLQRYIARLQSEALAKR